MRSARRLAPVDRLGPAFDANVLLVLDYARGVALRTGLLTAADAAAARAAAAATLVRLLDLD